MSRESDHWECLYKNWNYYEGIAAFVTNARQMPVDGA